MFSSLTATSTLAVVSKHLTPATFAAEARKLPQRVPFIAVHIKSRFYDQVTAELRSLASPFVEVGTPGTPYEF
jgi:hypothetical protein